MAEKDNINPSHYQKDGRWQPIDLIEDRNLDFCLGNAVKYISRAGKKDPSTYAEGLKKAKWYIERLHARLKSGGYKQPNTYLVPKIDIEEYCKEKNLNTNLSIAIGLIVQFASKFETDLFHFESFLRRAIEHLNYEIEAFTYSPSEADKLKAAIKGAAMDQPYAPGNHLSEVLKDTPKKPNYGDDEIYHGEHQ